MAMQVWKSLDGIDCATEREALQSDCRYWQGKYCELMIRLNELVNPPMQNQGAAHSMSTGERIDQQARVRSIETLKVEDDPDLLDLSKMTDAEYGQWRRRLQRTIKEER